MKYIPIKLPQKERDSGHLLQYASLLLTTSP